MRTVSAGQSAILSQNDRSVVTIVSIAWGGTFGTEYYTDRDDVDIGLTSKPYLQSYPQYIRRLATGLERRLVLHDYEMTLRNDPWLGDRPSDRIQSLLTINGLVVNLYKVFEDSSLAQSDWIHFGEYRIVDYTERTDSLSLVVSESISLEGSTIVGERITSDEYATAPEKSLGLMKPIIFGTVDAVPFIPIEDGAATTLASDIDAVVTVIPVVDVSVLPASGSVYIDDEQIDYTAVDVPGNTIGTAGTPATRSAGGTSASTHDADAPVREILSRYRHIISWHTNHAVNDPIFLYRGESHVIPVADYTITNTTDADGHNISYFDWDALPILGDGTVLTLDEVQVVAEVAGIVDPYLLTEALARPANVIRFILTDSDFFGLNASYVDLTGLANAVVAVGGVTRLGRRLFLRQTAMEILFSAVSDSGLHMHFDEGQFRFFPTLDVPSTDSVDLALDYEDDIFPVLHHASVEDRGVAGFVGPTEKRVLRRDSNVVNKLTVRWNLSYMDRLALEEASFDSLTVYEDAISQAQSWGIREDEYRAEWIRDSSSMDELGNHILDQRAWRQVQIFTRSHLEYLQLELGDVVTVHDPPSNLDTTRSRVVSFRFPVPQQVEIGSIVIQGRTRIWEYGLDPTNTYIDRYSGVGFLEVVIGGTTVGRVTSTGLVLMASGLREMPVSSEVVHTAVDSPNGEIEYNLANGSIAFALKRTSDGKFVRVAEWLPSGRLVCGRFRENQDFPLSQASSPTFTAVGYEWFDSVPGLDFTLDDLRTFVRFERVDIGGITNALFHHGSYRESGV